MYCVERWCNYLYMNLPKFCSLDFEKGIRSRKFRLFFQTFLEELEEMQCAMNNAAEVLQSAGTDIR